MKRFLCLLLCAALLTGGLCVSLSGCTRTPSAPPFGVLAFAGSESTRIDLWFSEAENVYYLFLPADADRSALTVVCDGSVAVDGVELTDGQQTDIFAEKELFFAGIGKRKLEIRIRQTGNIPAVFIRTASGSLDAIHADKEHKETAEMTVVEDGAVTLSRAKLAHIKGRGNTTWENEKKPYNIKFEEKTALLGMNAAKKWALLADADPMSCIAEPVLFGLARQTDLAYTPESRHAALFVNGEYLGLYRVSERVQVGKNRLDIDDLDKANEKANPQTDLSALPKKKTLRGGEEGSGGDVLQPGERLWSEGLCDPADISGGYLLEFESRAREAAFSTSRGLILSLRSPEYASRGEIDLIADLYQRAEDALYSEDGYNDRGEHWSDLFDVASFVDLYLLQEFGMYSEGENSSSTYIYKPAGEDRFYAGPVWDAGASWLFAELPDLPVTIKNDTFRYASSLIYYMLIPDDTGTEKCAVSIPSFFNAMFRHEEFRTAAAKRWAALSEPVSKLPDAARDLFGALASAIEADAHRWNTGEETGEMPAVQIRKQFSDRLAVMRRRTEVLNRAFTEDAAVLYYDANGGKGAMSHPQFLHIGEEAAVSPAQIGSRSQAEITESVLSFETPIYLIDFYDSTIIPPSKEYEFAGWNTKPDGSGDMYQPGESFTVTQTTTVLWAQWKKQ